MTPASQEGFLFPLKKGYLLKPDRPLKPLGAQAFGSQDSGQQGSLSKDPWPTCLCLKGALLCILQRSVLYPPPPRPRIRWRHSRYLPLHTRSS